MLKDRAQQVVLAVATFDADGKLLVSQSGLMPCQTITRQFQQRVSQGKNPLFDIADAYRHSTTSSTPPILCFNGFSGSLVTGPVLPNLSHRCENIYKLPAIYNRQVRQVMEWTAGHHSTVTMTTRVTPQHSGSCSVLLPKRSPDRLTQVCRTWERSSRMYSRLAHCSTG